MTRKRNRPGQIGPALVMVGLLLVTGLVLKATSAAETLGMTPPPALDVIPSAATSEVAVLAGGCFWGVQGVFQHVEGVTNAVSGYAGGDAMTAHYQIVANGLSKHAESVQVTFDPRKISFGRILQIYFSVAHDPTQLNRQGPDVGAHYRSTVFPANDEQDRVARAYIAQIDQAKVYARPVVTAIEADRAFYPAEDYHQDYMTLNPRQPYIVFNDLPKVEDLKHKFPELYRAEPVLVMAGKKR